MKLKKSNVLSTQCCDIDNYDIWMVKLFIEYVLFGFSID